MDRMPFINAMRAAIQNGQLDEVKRLIKEEPEKLNLHLPWGSWLNVALLESKPEIVKYFLEAGIDKSILIPITNGNAVNDAAAMGTPEVIRYLVENGIDVILSTDDSNPVFDAINADNLENLKYLLDYEKDKMEPNKYQTLCEKVKWNAEVLKNEPMMLLFSDSGLNKQQAAKIERNKLITNIISAVKSVIEPIRNEYSEEKIYIMSMEVDKENYSFWFYVNTEENFKQSITKNADDPWYYRFCEYEWYVYEDTPTHFKKATQYLNGLKGEIDLSDVYECIVEAFVKLRKEEFFEKVFGRFVFLTINATENFDEETMIKFVKKINGKENCKDYIANIESFY